ncbi:hypothetical protein COEREDRAFT_50722, partial [Coemansia reversa NRRL 1564]
MDGVAISIIFKTEQGKANGQQKRLKATTGAAIAANSDDDSGGDNNDDDDEANGESDHCQSIHKMLPEKLYSTIGKCVLMDPGRGGIFHCMHEMSTPIDRKVFR